MLIANVTIEYKYEVQLHLNTTIYNYQSLAAKARLASCISFLLKTYVRPVAVVGLTWVKILEESMSTTSPRSG